MGWPGRILVALLAASAGTLAAGWVASLAVRWYRVSSFEGGAGYFVVAFALLGLLVGLVVGGVAGRFGSAGGAAGFVRAAGGALTIVLAIAAATGSVARALADVPPTLDGRDLLLVVEVRWPASRATSPATEPGEAFLRLGSVTAARVMRASRRGPLWTEDARRVDGRWVATGVVDVFTTRGRRSLSVEAGGRTLAGFLLPSRGRPRRSALAWSAWLPRAAARDGFAVRYRMQPAGAAVRVQTLGPFEVVTHAYGYAEAGATVVGSAEFTVAYRGRPVVAEHAQARRERFDRVLALPGAPAALLVHAADADGDAGTCHLVRDDGARATVELLSESCGGAEVTELTSDAARFHARRRAPSPDAWGGKGEVDRTTLAGGGVYLVRDAVLDVDRRAAYPLQSGHAEEAYGMPPLGLSPDRRSFVRFGAAQQDEARPQLIVTDAVERRNYALPIDPARMRYRAVDEVDPAWVLHHFAWVRDGHGVDRLVERRGFVPIPYRGQLTTPSSTRWYRLEPAREGLCAAVLSFLAAEFHAEPLPRASDGDARAHPLRIGGQTVTVECRADDHHVDVRTEYEASDTRVLDSIARRFDAALATGKYDALFGR